MNDRFGYYLNIMLQGFLIYAAVAGLYGLIHSAMLMTP